MNRGHVPLNTSISRMATDTPMRAIAARTGQRYVDEYAKRWHPTIDLAA